MRKIIFRARLKVEKKLAYWNEFGELTTKTGKVRRLTIIDSYGRTRYYSHVWEIKHLIELETVGQYVCRDKKQNLIFEGDIVRVTTPQGIVANVLVQNGEYFDGEEHYIGVYGMIGEESAAMLAWKDEHYEVIGNKWDNPELLEGNV